MQVSPAAAGHAATERHAPAWLMSCHSGDPGLRFEGLVPAAIPAILFYAIFQNYIIKGMVEGSTR